jgi:hypothetical protein
MRKGVAGWRHTLLDLPCPGAATTSTTGTPVPPTPVATELINALAAVALAGT